MILFGNSYFQSSLYIQNSLPLISITWREKFLMMLLVQVAPNFTSRWNTSAYEVKNISAVLCGICLLFEKLKNLSCQRERNQTFSA